MEFNCNLSEEGIYSILVDSPKVEVKPISESSHEFRDLGFSITGVIHNGNLIGYTIDEVTSSELEDSEEAKDFIRTLIDQGWLEEPEQR